MKLYQAQIKNINYNKDFIIIDCNKKQIKIYIIDGTVNINIFTNENKKVSYTYLDENDIINIYYKKKEQDYIIPHKIIINTKYSLNSDSSDFETII